MLRKRNIPKFIGTVVLVAGCNASGEVRGVVRDARTGRAIEGARVSRAGGDSDVHTDRSGRFVLSAPLTSRLDSAWNELALALPAAPPDRGDDVWSAHEQWALSPMWGHWQTKDECSACHVAMPSLELFDFDRAWVNGREEQDLGAGGTCVGCHQREAELVFEDEHGVNGHGVIADTCASCHLAPWRPADPSTITLGHTFAIADRNEAWNPDACSACHGEEASRTFEFGDYGRDGQVEPMQREFDRAFERARVSVSRRLRSAGLRVTCRGVTRVGSDLRESRGLLVVIDASGRPLECAENPTGLPKQSLPPALASHIEQLTEVLGDRSRGAHNPRHTFGLLQAIAESPL